MRRWHVKHGEAAQYGQFHPPRQRRSSAFDQGDGETPPMRLGFELTDAAAEKRMERRPAGSIPMAINIGPSTMRLPYQLPESFFAPPRRPFQASSSRALPGHYFCQVAIGGFQQKGNMNKMSHASRNNSLERSKRATCATAGKPFRRNDCRKYVLKGPASRRNASETD